MAPTVQETLRECIAMLGAALPSARDNRFLGTASAQEIREFRNMINNNWREKAVKENGGASAKQMDGFEKVWRNRVVNFKRAHPNFDVNTDGGGEFPDD